VDPEDLTEVLVLEGLIEVLVDHTGASVALLVDWVVSGQPSLHIHWRDLLCLL